MKEDNKNAAYPGISWIWWLIMIALLAWIVWNAIPKSSSNASIPYSTFLQQVNAGNVAQISISSSQITGDFINSVLLPQTRQVVVSKSSQATPVPATQVTSFTTNFPEAVGDPSLMPLLASKGIVVNVAPPPSPLFQLLLTYGLPILLLVIVMIWLGRQTTHGGSSTINMLRSNPRRYSGDQPQITFADVADVSEAKADLQQVVDFLRQPEKYHKLGARIPRGVLLVGPPGTGKTLLARAVAGEAGVPFYNISASEFVEMFVGVGAGRVRDLFAQAKSSSPAIVFIDELDAVGRRRGTGLGNVNDEREQTLNQLLVEMDGFDERQEVIVLAATNRPDVLDPALLRPGRFDRQVSVSLPDRQGRVGILGIHARNLIMAKDVSLDLLARTTTGFSGADLANLCNEAALVAAKGNHEQVDKVDFEEALDRVLLGAARTLLLSNHDREVVAYHEAGHALVAWLVPAADPVHKVTIIPRGRALGVTEQLPGDDQYNYSRAYLLARLAVMLAGRIAEEVAIGDITTGAENDLVEATRLARRMVTRWAMGDLGPVALGGDEDQPFLGYELSHNRDYSEETAAQIDQGVRDLLEERYQFVEDLLGNSARPRLDHLAQVLLQEETIGQDELARILGPRSSSEKETLKADIETDVAAQDNRML